MQSVLVTGTNIMSEPFQFKTIVQQYYALIVWLDNSSYTYKQCVISHAGAHIEPAKSVRQIGSIVQSIESVGKFDSGGHTLQHSFYP